MDALGRPKRVVVFGGRSEIACEALRELASCGMSEVVLAVRESEREPEVDLGDDVRIQCIEFDAADLESIPGAVEACFEALGGVDLVLVAAGVLGPVGDQLVDGDAAAQAFQVNAAGVPLTLLEAARRMRAAGFGDIVLISSVAVERLRPSNFVYGASKQTADAVARTLDRDLRGSGVRIRVVRPGYVRTRLSRGVPEAPFAVGPATVGRDVVSAALKSRRVVTWTPRPLRAVGMVLRLLPHRLLARLDRAS